MYMWNLKNMMTVSITKEADLQMYRTNMWLPAAGGNIEAREWEVQTTGRKIGSGIYCTI